MDVNQNLVVEEKVGKYLDCSEEDTSGRQGDLGWWDATGVLGYAQSLYEPI